MVVARSDTLIGYARLGCSMPRQLVYWLERRNSRRTGVGQYCRLDHLKYSLNVVKNRFKCIKKLFLGHLRPKNGDPTEGISLFNVAKKLGSLII
jgi:hypothetical protein